MSSPTFTPNLHLTKAPANYRVWADLMNDNLTLLDAAVTSFVQFNNLRGAWANSTAYAVGDTVVDSDTAVLWSADVEHVSSSIPTTFAEELVAHPTYWLVANAPATSRGIWTGPGTTYNVNDFVLADGTKYAMCLVQHVSSATFNTDLLLTRWSVLIDLSVFTPSADPKTLTLRFFGAAGTGGTDDSAALTLAFAAQASTGIRLDGEGLTYGVGAPLLMTATDVWLQNCTFIDLSPTLGGTGRILLKHETATASCVFKNVKFNRNGDGSEGSLSAVTLALYNGDNILLEDVEVYGDGAGRAINIESADNVKIIRPYIHDMNWERAVNPGSELILGIFLVSCTNVSIEGHVIENLTGTVLGVQQVGPAASYRNTDAISLSGCTDAIIANGFTDTAGEGVDITGSLVNTNVNLVNNTYHNCSGYSEKFVHGAYDCSTRGARYYNSGIAGLTASGGGTALSPEDFVADDCIAYDTGAIGGWAASASVAGILIAGGVGPLLNIWITNCKAYSTSQEFGILNSGAVAGEIHVLNFDTSGATIAAVSGVTAALSQITAAGRFTFTGGVDIDTLALSGAMTGTAADFSGIVEVGSIDWATALRITNTGSGVVTATSIAGTEGVRFDFSTDNTFRVLNRTGGANNAIIRAAFGNFDTDITAHATAAIGAGATTQAWIKASSTANLGIYYGTGAPGFSAAKGSLYSRTDATTTTTRLYVNTDGAATWANFTSSA